MRRAPLAAAFLLLAYAVFATPAPGHEPLKIFVFGDSYSDNGNLTTYHPEFLGEELPPIYDPQRFSNGPIWVDYASQVLRTTIAPEVDGGTNYAVSAATISPDHYFSLWPDVSGFAQVDRYLAQYGTADPDAVYVIYMGGNDLDAPAEFADWAFSTLVEMVDRLYSAGARKFLFPNLDDLGATPYFRLFLPPEYAAAISQLTVYWNELLGGLDEQFPEATIRISDVYRLKKFVDQHPQLFGFTNTTDPCWDRWGDGSVCPDPDRYWFWDYSHPTTRTHRLFSSLFIVDMFLAGEIHLRDFRR